MLLVNIVCNQCGKSFSAELESLKTLKISDMPRRCPECIDRRQNRPTEAIDRQCLYETPVKLKKHQMNEIFSHSGKKEPHGKDDKPFWHFFRRGSYYDATWSGVISLYLHIDPQNPPEYALFRDMQVEKRIWLVSWQSPSRRTGTALHHKRVDRNYQVAEGEKMAEEIQTDTYQILLPLNGEPPENCPEIVFLEAYSKTTLKGFGRQFHREFKDNSLWSRTIEGHVRSGRLGTVAKLAVVDNEHQLILKESGDV